MHAQQWRQPKHSSNFRLSLNHELWKMQFFMFQKLLFLKVFDGFIFLFETHTISQIVIIVPPMPWNPNCTTMCTPSKSVFGQVEMVKWPFKWREFLGRRIGWIWKMFGRKKKKRCKWYKRKRKLRKSEEG